MGQWLVIQEWLRLAGWEKAYLGLIADFSCRNRQNLKECPAADGQLTVIRVRGRQAAGRIEIKDDAVLTL